jgi:hypothetical protein
MFDGGGKNLPRTVSSAGLEETMAAAKAMVRSLGSLSWGCAMFAAVGTWWWYMGSDGLGKSSGVRMRYLLAAQFLCSSWVHRSFLVQKQFPFGQNLTSLRPKSLLLFARV